MNTPVVLITGALTGIGRAIALAFAKEGSHVVISGRREDAGRALVTELRALGAEAEFVRADVRHEEDVRNLVDKTVERFGRLDVAVNNAGTENKPGPLTEQSAETYAVTFDTNVLGTILSLKHGLRAMLAQGHGNIVNLSSTFGSRGAAGASIYVASKHAVEGLTKAAALEGAASGVRVNAVAPGPVENTSDPFHVNRGKNQRHGNQIDQAAGTQPSDHDRAESGARDGLNSGPHRRRYSTSIDLERSIVSAGSVHPAEGRQHDAAGTFRPSDLLPL
jgi:NAD(P)-dependent dehydrogenase (short-subunit alcohol dehydrogenase family)